MAGGGNNTKRQISDPYVDAGIQFAKYKVGAEGFLHRNAEEITESNERKTMVGLIKTMQQPQAAQSAVAPPVRVAAEDGVAAHSILSKKARGNGRSRGPISKLG